MYKYRENNIVDEITSDEALWRHIEQEQDAEFPLEVSRLQACVATKENTILVVDDDPDQRLLIETLLTTRGFRVISAENAWDALEILLEKQIDLVVSDLMMPELDGINFAIKIRRQLKLTFVPIIILTAGRPERQVEALVGGADLFFVKDRMKDFLADHVQLLLSCPTKRKALKEQDNADRVDNRGHLR